MSVISRLDESVPNFGWIVGSLPLAVALDLALGDLPGRTHVARGLNWLIEVVDGAVQATMTRLGGGRGGELFGGLLLTTMVAGTTASLVWLIVELGDTIGGVASLGVRSVVIAAGLVIRANGDRISCAAEATDPVEARRWLSAVGGCAPGRLDQDGVHSVCMATVGEYTSGAIVAPLFWLAAGGPAGLWGWLAVRSLRQAQESSSRRTSLAARVPILLANLAEWLPAVGTWGLITLAAAIVRLNPGAAWRTGWREGRAAPRFVPIWSQAALAGALGVGFRAGRVLLPARTEPHPRVGDPLRPPSAAAIALAIRVMQVVALITAGSVAVGNFFR